MSEPLPTLLLIPTGIGCDQGGFAGDGLPVARLLAAASDCLITHPNVMNGAALYWSDPRIHYVEGWSLDAFAKGLLRLRPQRRQRIGVLFDAGIEPELLLRHRQVLAAARATLGLEIGPVLVSDEPLGVKLSQASSGSSWGHLEQPAALLRAGSRLKQEGATAIAVVARFPDDNGSDALQAYRSGSGVDALAGAEAVISHLLVRELQIPCAHAPALAACPMADLDPRAAAGGWATRFALCARGSEPSSTLCRLGAVAGQELAIDQVGAVVAPAGALGGETVLACADRHSNRCGEQQPQPAAGGCSLFGSGSGSSG